MVRLAVFISALLFSSYSMATERLTYAGSSTIGKIVADSTVSYKAARFNIRTLAESAQGERCVQAATCDIGGVAREVDVSDLVNGVSKTLIGWDVISIIVAKDNPVESLSLNDLKQIYTGKIDNWSQLGGADLPLTAYAVKPASATHQVFSNAVLGGGQYQGVTIIPFDAKMTFQVAQEKGSIGMISAAFSRSNRAIKIVAIDGKLPDLSEAAYPIVRPLYMLLPAKIKPEAQAYIDWVVSEEGQAVVQKRFMGIGRGGS